MCTQRDCGLGKQPNQPMQQLVGRREPSSCGVRALAEGRGGPGNRQCMPLLSGAEQVRHALLSGIACQRKQGIWLVFSGLQPPTKIMSASACGRRC